MEEYGTSFTAYHNLHALPSSLSVESSHGVIEAWKDDSLGRNRDSWNSTNAHTDCPVTESRYQQ
jgi:hypothetical protein